MSRTRPIAFENRDRYVALGLTIAYYRKLEGLTQMQLAEKADISRGYMSAIEAPNMIVNVSLEVLFCIAKALRVEPEKFLTFRD